MITAGPFSTVVTGLSCNTTYYYRAYAEVGGVLIAVGSEVSFTTATCPPVTVTNPATSPSSTGITLQGVVSNLGGASSVNVSFEYGVTSAYGISTVPSSLFSTGPFSRIVTGLTCGTLYHYRAVSSNTSGVGYGANATFSTLPCPTPSVSTTTATVVTGTSAVLNGNLTSLGGVSSANLYFLYSTTSGFTGGSTGTPTISASTTGPFSAVITGLTCGTVYYYRAYATLPGGLGSTGLELPFTTGTCLTTPPPGTTSLLTTMSATAITSTSATLQGSVSGVALSDVGFQYGVTTAYGGGGGLGASVMTTGPYSYTITSLTCNTTYHYRAKQFGSTFVAPGSDSTFTTLPCVSVTTDSATVSATSFTLNGTLGGLGSASSAVVGFNYGLTSGYGSTVTLSTPVTTAGPFSQIISVSVLCGSTYNYRAYATVSGITSYGLNQTFTTDPCGSPAVYTGTASLSGRTATLSGLLTFIASWPSATVGFEYGTALTYGSTATVSPAMVATGSFSLPISGLECDTTYYYRAIASGAGGTAQGTRSSFIIPRATCLTGGGVGTDTGAGAGSGGGVRSVPIGGIVTYGSDTPIAQEIADYFAEISFDTLPLVQPVRETTPPEAGRTAPRISLNVISSRKIDEDTVVATVSWTALNIAPKTCVGTSTPAVQGWNGETKEPSEDMRPGISRTYQEIIVGIKQEAKISLEGCVGTDGTKIVPASVTVASELAETAGMPAGSEETPRGGRNVIIEQI